MHRSMSKKVLACVLALTLALPAVLSGCSAGGTSVTASASVRGAQELAQELKERYEPEQTVAYEEGESGLERDHVFTVSFDFDPIALGMEGYDEIASLYYDAELTQYVPTYYDWASEDKQSFTLAPWENPGRGATTFEPEKYPYGFDDESPYLHDRGDYADWGNTGTLYLATFVDLETGEKLEKPIVQVLTMKGELATPNISLNMTNEGEVQIVWDEIEGADAYYLVRYSIDEEDGSSYGYDYVDSTTEAVWTVKEHTLTYSDTVTAMNTEFKTFKIAEDDWLNPKVVEEYAGEFDPTDGAVASPFSADKRYCVIAVNETGNSMYSQSIDVNDVASLAPYAPAYNMNRLSDEGFSGYVKGVNMMPSHYWITMCDGASVQRLVNYDFDKAVRETQTWAIDEFEDGNWEFYDEGVILVPYAIEGTTFAGELVISEYDKDAWEEQLKAIQERQESLRSRTGDLTREVSVEDDKVDPSDPSEGEGTEIFIDEDTVITANSALSEYLALNMLSGVEVIDLTEFPEALDTSYLIDAWSEAYYQNPLILGVSEAMVSPSGKTLYVTYEDSKETRKQKQTEISETVTRVVSEIITDSMTPREKEFAINQYLCDTVVYDFAALENAEENSFLTVDSEFYDSFNAYGALVSGVGVCASYSASFKLLADEAGLECMVVTGYLEGSLGHAWNRVNLGDGRWVTVDSTNNDTDYMPNAFMNVPDSVIASTLVEDDLWVMNTALANYSNEDDSDEYYRVEGLYFGVDAVADELMNQLATSDIAVVRTDYHITDAEFYAIGESILESTGNYELGGFYWLGVIVMTNDYTLLTEA